MKIAYLSDSIIPSSYANSVNVMKMCESFGNAGHTTTLFARMGKKSAITDYEIYGVKPNFTIRKNWRPKIFPSRYNIKIYLYQLKNKLQQMDDAPDLFYGRDLYSFESLLDWGIPMIYEAHFPPDTPKRIAAFRHLFASKNFKRLVPVSYAIKDAFVNLFPEIASKIIVVPSATDTVCPDCLPIQNWPCNPQNIQVGYVGSLFPGTGMDVVWQIAQKSYQEKNNIDFHILGGHSKDLSYWKSICKASTNIFFHGFVEHKDLDRYYAHFDILLAPYTTNGTEWVSPLKVAEYMARRKPIIGSDIPIVQAMIRHNESAILVNPNDINGWLIGIEKLASDNELSQRLVKKAYAEFLANYTWDNRAKIVLGHL